MKKIIRIFFAILFLQNIEIIAQGTWAPLSNISPDPNGGVMLLLTDGTVMAKTFSGGFDNYGNIWNKLTPDSTGSYLNGKWTTLAPMHDTRLYFASQVLQDGRVFVAGGEYGTGQSLAEVYNPLTNTWVMTSSQPQYFGDSNSELTPDGNVLIGTLQKPPLKGNSDSTLIYNPKTNTWSIGPISHGSHDEAAWVKLADNSILFVNDTALTSERFIPSLNQWVIDAPVPVSLYDSYGAGESGAAFLLPDGRAFFIGATSQTAYYTPSGNSSPGAWAIGPTIPNSLGATDAAAAMMVNGKILCAVSPVATSSSTIYNTPTYYYEFDYLSNSFTQVAAPGGGTSVNEACFETNMLDLPDGTVLYADQGTQQYYVYNPLGTPLEAGRPTIGSVTQINCDTFKINGTLFNGISEGAAYGDDWQMGTNYPIIKLASATNVYYARSFNWNSTGVQRGNLPDTAFFSIPNTVSFATYSLSVIANGISSNPILFTYNKCFNSINNITQVTQPILLYPNPAKDNFTIETNDLKNETVQIYDLNCKLVLSQIISGSRNLDVSSLNEGIYNVCVMSNDGIVNKKLVIIR